MNPHAPPPISPWSLWRSLRRNRRLLYELSRREIISRYQGSIAGVFWSLLQPVLTLALYTFVFALVLKVRWPGQEEATSRYALVLFAGLMLFNLLSEILNRAPALLMAHSNYVKRVVFPLELLPVASAIGVLSHVLVQLLVWLVALCAATGSMHWNMLWAPLLMLPLFVLALGLSWMLAGVSVFLRDLVQLVPIASAALVFLAPVFYPLDAVPVNVRGWIEANPLTFVVEQFRAVVIAGEAPQVVPWLLYAAISSCAGWLGYVAFQRLRPRLADEL